MVSRWCRCSPCGSRRRRCSSTSTPSRTSPSSAVTRTGSGSGRWPGTPTCSPTPTYDGCSRWSRSPSGTSRTRPSATGAPPSARSCTRTPPRRCRWCSRLLGGSVDVVGPDGRRTIAADDLYVGPLESSVRPDEIAVEAFFPALPAGAGVAFEEIARRHGDYALCGVAAAGPRLRRPGGRGEGGLPVGVRRADGRRPHRRAGRRGWATPRWSTSTRPTTSTPRRTTAPSWCGC